ncbi:MAG: FAD-dependent oxidoreductase [Pseudomonadota bacterium]
MTVSAQWSETADVVIVGAGGAGLIAACTAARAGSRVVLIEKAPRIGGTTALAVGSIMAAGTQQQRDDGIVDSAADHAEDLAGVARGFGISDNADLSRLMATHAAEAVAFLRSIGVVFANPLPQPPHRQPRLHQVMPGSASYIHHLDRACRKAGVVIHASTAATRLVQAGGRVAGVEVKDDSGALRIIGAAKGVILASGDIAGNAALLKSHIGEGLDGIEVLNPWCTGDGHTMGAAAGAQIVSRTDYGAGELAQMRFVKPAKPNWTQRIPPFRSMAWLIKTALQYPPAVAVLRPFVLKFLTTALGVDRGIFVEGALLINKRGERFADELAGTILQDVGSHERTAVKLAGEANTPNLLLPRQPEGVGYIVFDERIARQFSSWPHFISTAPGVAYAYLDDYRRARPDIFHSAPTLAGLAGQLGMDVNTLQASVKAAMPERGSKALTGGPFYALGPIKSWLLVTPVGLAVNTRLEVLDAQGQAIQGLYAAGGVGQGGFTNTGHGHGLAWAFTSGLLAGRQASTAAQNT